MCIRDRCAVIGIDDPVRGQVIKAFIVLSEGVEPLNVQVGNTQAMDKLAGEIQQSVKTRLAAHEYPRIIEFIDALPMTTTGKVRRVALREREKEQSLK